MKTAKTSTKLPRGTKENKTMRFTPRTLFDLEFWSPLERQTETGLVEAALEHYIKHVVAKRHDDDVAGVWDSNPIMHSFCNALISLRNFNFDEKYAGFERFIDVSLCIAVTSMSL